MDWRTEIVKGVLIHQRMRELDRDRLWEYHLPAIAASDDELSATEFQLGYELEGEYRNFLRHANGWRTFYQDVDILGTPALLGAGVMRYARSQLDSIEPQLFLDEVGVSTTEVLPIAASGTQSDMFLIAKPDSRLSGAVFWFAGQLIERFQGFDEFYLSMLDYNRLQIRIFEESSGPNGR